MYRNMYLLSLFKVIENELLMFIEIDIIYKAPHSI